MTIRRSLPVKKTVESAVVITIALLVGMVWVLWTIYRSHTEIRTQEAKMLELQSAIVYLDEVLTMSAHMAAATGSLEWEARYLSFEPKLDAAIKEAERLASSRLTGEIPRQTETANIKLVEMEHAAFSLIRQGRQKDAAALLSGKDYQEQKRFYIQGLDQIMATLRDQALAHHDAQRKRAILGVACFGTAALIIIVGTWIYLTRMVGRYVAERARSEKELRETNQALQALIHASPISIMVLDREGKVRLWNPASERIFGWSEKEVLGHPLPTIPPGKEEEHRVFCERVPTDSASSGIEARRLRKDGILIDISLSTAPLRDADGNIVGALELVTDITDRVRMEAQSRRLERMATMGQLLGGISHELKNPLFILSGRLQLMKEKLGHQEYGNLGSDLQKIDEAAVRMTAIAQRFLHLVKPVKPQWQKCSVYEVLNETLEFMSNEFMKKCIRVVTVLAPSLPVIWSEPRQLHEVFLNLMMNAVQAMVSAHGQGTLTVVTALEEGWITVRIQDDGPGIAPEHYARLFEPFFTTKQEDQGTGLGLWTVKTMLATLRGEVGCETRVGQGTSFMIRLPIVSTPPTEKEHANHEQVMEGLTWQQS